MRPPFATLLQTFAVSVATVLGTGILGLPVALHASGLRPFLALFVFNLISQIGVIAATTEILHLAFRASAPHHYQPLDPHAQSHAPSLHSLASRFISVAFFRTVFSFLVLLHFLFILSTYALAGPQAYVALFPILATVPIQLIQTVFVLVSALLIISADTRLLPSVTLATIAKALLLTVLVSLTLARSLTIREPVHDDWRLPVLIDPLLMGTMALSGVVNLMPVTFHKSIDSLPPTDATVDRQFVAAYRNATVIGIIVCFLLNIAWAIAVLFSVPQSSSSSAVAHATRALVRAVKPCATLQEAYDQGQIATIPLVKVLQCRKDSLDSVISFIVNLFIVVSITVSFLVMSMGMKHYLDGQAREKAESPQDYDYARGFRYLVCFGIVLGTALANPHGLFRIMEGVTTLALNIEAGLFMLFMLYVARSDDGGEHSLLSPLAASFVYLFVGFYFLTVVCVDSFFYLPRTILRQS
ncbi:hypothetical protein BWQ96_05500 [Gracilariopsis chorda]|uniref:Amino acid transporter transmembrane domain-containing protein n=1 Tax=Gracilariopsis chorda TaxID=448386 RepID=A0A2V3IRI6_9FLOR|nr:hypothetical protein BWQ96_05500 [Gracilariopsis chorda]|eukprot:PXF44741.1 hypothetical protein BWQ96_05500 [Gracilariopsis chorda]